MNQALVTQSWLVATGCIGIVGLLLGAPPFTEAILLCFLILSLPVGLVVIPVIYFIHLQAGYLILGDSMHFSYISLVLLGWAACLLCGFVQFRVLGYPVTTSISLKGFALGFACAVVVSLIAVFSYDAFVLG